MRPGEFFIFSRKKYRLKTSDRSTDELHTEEFIKNAKINVNKKMIPMEILIAILSHGAGIWLVIISLRSIDVSKWKIEIIRSELRKRFLAEHEDVIKEVERENGRRFTEIELDALLRLVRAGQRPEWDSSESRSSSHAGNRQEEVTEDRVEESEDRVESPPPPPYTNSAQHKTNGSNAAEVPAPAYS